MTIQAITLPSDHFLVTPPHCMKRMVQTAHAMEMHVAPQSHLTTCMNMSFEYPLYVVLRPSGGAAGWAKKIRTRATPPLQSPSVGFLLGHAVQLQWKVYIETPSPCNVVSECPAYKWSDDRGDGVTKRVIISFRNYTGGYGIDITPNKPKYFARSCSVVSSAMIMMPAEKIPAAPAPAMARPRMRTRMLGATPQTREPSSKMETASMMTCFEGNIWASCE